MTIPSTVGVPPATSSTTSLSRSPAAPINEIAGVLSSLGVTPAVPPPCTGVLSCIVSDPLNTVIRLPVVVERISKMTDAGHGRYSYCHPDRGFNPSWFAVIAVEKLKFGISAPAKAHSLRSLARGHRAWGTRFPCDCSRVSCIPTRGLLPDSDVCVLAVVRSRAG